VASDWGLSQSTPVCETSSLRGDGIYSIFPFRQLLDEQLGEALEGTSLDLFRSGNAVLEAMLAMLTNEGFSG